MPSPDSLQGVSGRRSVGEGLGRRARAVSPPPKGGASFLSCYRELRCARYRIRTCGLWLRRPTAIASTRNALAVLRSHGAQPIEFSGFGTTPWVALPRRSGAPEGGAASTRWGSVGTWYAPEKCGSSIESGSPQPNGSARVPCSVRPVRYGPRGLRLQGLRSECAGRWRPRPLRMLAGAQEDEGPRVAPEPFAALVMRSAYGD